MSTAKKKLTTCEPKTAVAYARYSSARQRDVSIDQQLRDIRAYAEREGYKIIYEYADHAKSGYHNSERRTEFQAMLNAASSGMFDTVIAWKVDRFGRNRRESAIYKGQLSDQGVSVVYAMEPIPDGAAGVLTEGMLESIAEWYSRNLSENTKRGQRDNSLKCITNGQRAFGYKSIRNQKLTINEPEAAVVRRIFDLYSQGYSYTAIAEEINKDGILTAYGKPFHRNTIMYMIQNDAYVGVYHYGDVTVPGGIPAIISEDLWELCQAMRRKNTKRHVKSEFNYYLSGKCTCGKCGANVHATHAQMRHGKKAYYVCGKKKADKTCDTHFMSKDDIEKAVFDFLFNKILKTSLMDPFIDSVSASLKASQETSPQMRLEEELRDINRKMKNIHQAIAEGIWTKQTGEILNQLNDRAEELQRYINTQKMTQGKIVSKDRIRFMFHKMAEGDRTDPEVLYTIVGSLINSITIYENWLRIAVNCVENVERIDPAELPPLEECPDGNRIGNCTASERKLCIVDPYPVIVFKIAI